jgi:hypothetical protein
MEKGEVISVSAEGLPDSAGPEAGHRAITEAKTDGCGRVTESGKVCCERHGLRERRREALSMEG